MLWVWLVVLGVCAHLFFVMALVGIARGKYDVKAPATSGHEMFERHNRVHQNSLEQVITFLPLLAICALSGTPVVAACAGAVFLLGRIIYGISYVKDPDKRTVGFLMGYLAQVVLILLSGYNVIVALI